MYVKNYSELCKDRGWKKRARKIFRATYIYFSSLGKRASPSSEWIIFPYYHHVFDDEKRCFAAQLKYMRNIGEFISLNDAVDILRKKKKIGGRYFCITFDDGFKNFIQNAAPIMAHHSCPSTVFIPTAYIGNGLVNRKEIKDWEFVKNNQIEFMTWDDCKNLKNEQIDIGSHTVSHARLVNKSSEYIRYQMEVSKETIEREVHVKCEHFSVPFGIPGKDYKKDEHEKIAREIGYRSFLTGERGRNVFGDSTFRVKRDHMIAIWKEHQLKYFFYR